MNPRRTAIAISIAALLAACAGMPAHKDSTLRADLAQTATGAPRLPGAGEPYPDAAWFAETLTPERAVQTALLNNPLVRAELARLDIAQAERIQAGLLGNPMLKTMALRPEGGGRWELDYSLMQSLYDVFTRSRRVAVADAAQQRVESEVLLRLVTLTQDVESAYYAAIAAKSRQELLAAQIDIDHRRLLWLQRQASQGTVSVATPLQQEADLAMREHGLGEAQAASATAMAGLSKLLGTSSTAPIHLPGQLPEFVLAGFDENQLQRLALARRPELRANEAGIAQAQAEKSLQSGALRNTEPSAGVAGMRGMGGDMSQQGVAIDLALPVFDTGRARRELADAQIRQAQSLALAQSRQVPLEVEQSLALLQARQIAFHHAQHHLSQQQQLLSLAERGYRAGLSDLSARLSAESNLIEAELQLLDAHSALWESGVALERATGLAIADAVPP